jgi:putative PIN family toxin of toxin-antitoxin system
VITAVVDTNILAAGFVRSNPNAAPALLLDTWLANALRLVVSDYILSELADVLTRPYFARRLSPAQAATNLPAVRSLATLVALPETISAVVADPDDDAIMATATSAPADYLVTGDKKLLDLGSYQEVTILTARAFLDLLRAAEAAAAAAEEPHATTGQTSTDEVPARPEEPSEE